MTAGSLVPNGGVFSSVFGSLKDWRMDLTEIRFF